MWVGRSDMECYKASKQKIIKVIWYMSGWVVNTSLLFLRAPILMVVFWSPSDPQGGRNNISFYVVCGLMCINQFRSYKFTKTKLSWYWFSLLTVHFKRSYWTTEVLSVELWNLRSHRSCKDEISPWESLTGEACSKHLGILGWQSLNSLAIKTKCASIFGDFLWLSH